MLEEGELEVFNKIESRLADKMAKVFGSDVDKLYEEGQMLAGLLLGINFLKHEMPPEIIAGAIILDTLTFGIGYIIGRRK